MEPARAFRVWQVTDGRVTPREPHLVTSPSQIVYAINLATPGRGYLSMGGRL